MRQFDHAVRHDCWEALPRSPSGRPAARSPDLLNSGSILLHDILYNALLSFQLPLLQCIKQHLAVSAANAALPASHIVVPSLPVLPSCRNNHLMQLVPF